MSKTILITNDDSVYAPGIHALVDAVHHLAERVVVVAPDKGCSGMGHAVTIASPLRIHDYRGFPYPNVESYATTGTPVDCIKLAVNTILQNEKPDICLSGINHGSNHSINVLYSGTMSAAIEASLENITSIGFSLDDFSMNADFTAAKHYATQITQKVMQMPKRDFFCLNVNIPNRELKEIAGIKCCRQAYGRYAEAFDERIDPNGKRYYWMTGTFLNIYNESDGDIHALEHGYVSVVPIQFDMTDNALLKDLKTIW